MTIQHKIAGGLVTFALFAWILAPLFAQTASAVGKMGQDVSIAISSGSHLRLIEHAWHNGVSADTDRGLVCHRVVHLHIADIGVRCRAAGPERQMVRLSAD
jgi:hypothetical protein